MKNVFSWISLYLLGIVWFLMASLFALFAVINPQTLKSALTENNIYQKIVPAALDETQKNYSPGDGSQIPLNDPAAATAIQKAFPASDLQRSSETVIDAVFAWLSGKTSQPEFQLDFTHNKQVLAAELGNYATNRAASLPPCTLKDLQAAQNQDVFTISCLPPGLTPAQVGQEASARIANNESFLKDPVINSNTTNPTTNEIQDKQPKTEPLRSFYQKKPLLSWLLPTLIILLAIAGIILAPNRLRAVKRLASIFFVATVSLGIIGAALMFASNRTGSSTASDKLSSDVALPIVSDLLQHAGTIYIWFAVISLVLGFGLLFMSKRLKAII